MPKAKAATKAAPKKSKRSKVHKNKATLPPPLPLDLTTLGLKEEDLIPRIGLVENWVFKVKNGRIPRPSNNFMLFRQQIAQRLKATGVPQQKLSGIIGSLWNGNLSEAERTGCWQAAYIGVKKEHLKRYPKYNYKGVLAEGKKRKEALTEVNAAATTPQDHPYRTSGGRPESSRARTTTEELKEVPVLVWVGELPEASVARTTPSAVSHEIDGQSLLHDPISEYSGHVSPSESIGSSENDDIHYYDNYADLRLPPALGVSSDLLNFSTDDMSSPWGDMTSFDYTFLY